MRIWLFLCTLLLAGVPAAWPQGTTHSETLFPAKKDGKWGYIDQRGRTLVEPRFDYAWPFSEGMALVSVNVKKGYIDSSGKLVVSMRRSIVYNGRVAISILATIVS